MAIESEGLLTIQEGAEIEATSENGRPIQALSGMKMQGGTLKANDGILSMGNINVEGGTLTSSGAFGIVLMNGELSVSGNAIITAIGANYAAAMFDNTDNAFKPAKINADGFVLRAGNNQADAVVKPAYDQLYPYLHISPAQPQPPVENPPVPVDKLPQNGDSSNVFLWSALGFISLFGMTMLARKRKEA